VRIAPDGEVEAQGPIVFQGYCQDMQATSEAFDGRWLRTGDLGRQDDDGYLYITGRKKDLIITAGGKNVAPEVLEDRLREHWLIEECVVVGSCPALRWASWPAPGPWPSADPWAA
jgi:long-chain acyl-CoA synthetase